MAEQGASGQNLFFLEESPKVLSISATAINIADRIMRRKDISHSDRGDND